MPSWLRHLHWREFLLLGLALAHLLAIAGFLGADIQRLDQQTGGWRRIDLEQVEALIRAGELSTREADWYRPAP